MSVAADAQLLLEDVTVGHELPTLNYEVTATTVVLGLWPRGTGGPCTTTRTSQSIATGRRTSS